MSSFFVAQAVIEKSMWINLWLAATNILAIPALFAGDWVHTSVVAAVCLASALMHLSETKHGLLGIHPFNKWSTLFLNIDRAMALFAGAYMIVNYPATLRIGLFGFLFMLIAEAKVTPQPIFVVAHTIWHAAVYLALA